MFLLWIPLKDHSLERLCCNASLLLRNIVPPVLVFSSLLIISQFVFLKLILFMDRASYRGLGATYHMSLRVYCEPPVACLPNQHNNYSTFHLCQLVPYWCNYVIFWTHRSPSAPWWVPKSTAPRSRRPRSSWKISGERLLSESKRPKRFEFLI